MNLSYELTLFFLLQVGFLRTSDVLVESGTSISDESYFDLHPSIIIS